MAEILTESFCERCGTRYTFQATAPRRQRLGKFKVLSKGLRKYVLDDSTTLDEAFADARSDEEREISSHQVEAFHQTFNFCLTCRQYTCSNCWNEAEGRCLTCAPNLSLEALPATFPTLGTTIAPAPETNGHLPSPPSDLAWPTIDLGRLEEDAAEEDAAEEAAPTNGAFVDDSRPADEAILAPVEAGSEDVEAFDTDIAARLEALAGPALEPIVAPEVEEAAPEAVQAAPEAVQATPEVEVAGPDDDADVPLDVLEAVRAKAAAEQLTEDTTDQAVERESMDVAPWRPVEPDAQRAEAPEPAALPEASEPEDRAAVAEPEDRAAAAAARTAWLLAQFRPPTEEAEPIVADAEPAAVEAEAGAEGSPPAAVDVPDEAVSVEPPLEEPSAPAPVTPPDALPAAAISDDDVPARPDDRVGQPSWTMVAPIEPPAVSPA
ncbi:MAG TPA: hypothetical protein VGK63_12505, partial [Candidatus Limnocylindrales bacterium]